AVTVVLLACVFFACVATWHAWSENSLPHEEIRIAAGKEDGLYYKFAKEFAKDLSKRTNRPVRVIATAGSEENAKLVQTGGADLALMQTVAPTPKGLAGIAPLFSEPLHFVVRKGTEIHAPKDLAGKRVALGVKGSTMRDTSQAVLEQNALSSTSLPSLPSTV